MKRSNQINDKSSNGAKSKIFISKNSIFRLLRQIKKEFQLLWTDKFNIFIALIVPPLVVALLGVTTSIGGSTSDPIDCVLVSYDSNTFINENNFTETNLDNYSAKYVEAVNNSNL